jgi:ATP/maltotriose-dependent transcriptional regulator MalT
VGRRRELELARSWIRAGDGVFVLGDSGVGKTALARMLAQQEEAAGRRVHYVVGHAVSRDTPFSALAGALGGLDTSGLSPAQARHALIGALRGEADAVPLLVLDDVQLVDDESARTVLELAAGGEVLVVATTQQVSGSSLARRLWRDGHCERMELRGLDGEEILEFLEHALDGPVDASVVATFSQRSQGNPLMLRELLGAARDSGSLERRAAWVLSGSAPISGGVTELIRERLDGLDDAPRDTMEVLAAAEPLSLPVALDLLDESVLDVLEGQGLVAVRPGVAGTEVVTAHPLYGEVLRAAMPVLRLRRARLRVASRLEAGDDARPGDLVRAALWRVEDAQPVDPQRLLVAARMARGLSLETAERLARAAAADGASLPAVLLLAEILTHRGRGEEAAALLATLPPDSLADDDREAIVYCAAVGQGLAAGDPGQGVAMVEGVLAGDRAATDQLRALHVSLLSLDARFDEALARGRPLVDDPRADAAVRTLAAIGVVGATYWQGAFDRAVRDADALIPIARSARSEVPYAESSLHLIAVSSLVDKGDHEEAERRALALRRQAEADSDAFAMPRSEYLLARVAQYRGRSVEATRRFRRCVATAGPFDHFILRHLWAMVARSSATSGDLEGAAEALAGGAHLVPMKPYEPEWDLAQAAVLAARLQMAEAADRAAWAASVAADCGEWSLAVAGYHDAARYGASRSVVAALRAVPAPDGALADVFRQHVDALTSGDAAGLDTVSQRFEHLGATYFAAEAAEEAALAHERRQSRRSAMASAQHARLLRGRCDALSPWLTGAASGAALTAREREVAALAVEGRSDAAIAEHLGVSIRTAQTHLARCYAKLGISRRTQLAAALAGEPGSGRSD